MSATAGLDLREDGNDFILSVTAVDGSVSEVRLSEDQVMTLTQSAPAFRERIVLRRSPEGGDISAVVVTPVNQIAIQPDSLGISVLLTLQSTTQGRMVYALSPLIARLILEHLPPALREIETAKPTRQ